MVTKSTVFPLEASERSSTKAAEAELADVLRCDLEALA